MKTLIATLLLISGCATMAKRATPYTVIECPNDGGLVAVYEDMSLEDILGVCEGDDGQE